MTLGFTITMIPAPPVVVKVSNNCSKPKETSRHLHACS